MVCYFAGRGCCYSRIVSFCGFNHWQLVDCLAASSLDLAPEFWGGGRFNAGGGGVFLRLLRANRGFCSSKFWRIWWWSNAGNWRRLCPGPRRISLILAGGGGILNAGGGGVFWRLLCRLENCPVVPFFVWGQGRAAQVRYRGGKLGEGVGN